MNIIEKNLRRLVPDEIKALLEKADSLDGEDDRSLYPIKEYAQRARITWLEKFLLKRVIWRIERRDALVDAMNIVLNQKGWRYGYGTQIGAAQSASSLNLKEQLAKSIHATGNVVQSNINLNRAQAEVDRRVVVRRKPAA